MAVAVIGAVAAVGVLTNHSYVSTPSMYPTIPPGSEIFVSPQHSYHVGQVIEFRANGLTWAHRLIAIKPNGDFVTKGDNPQNSADVFVPPVTQRDVIGAVTHAPRWLGFPELVAHDPSYGLAWMRAELGVAGRIALILIISVFVALVGVRRCEQNRPPASADRHRRPQRSAAVVESS